MMEPQLEHAAFADAVAELFRARFDSLYRYLDRLTGDADLAMDLAQETFIRLYRRGELPDDPQAWITTVATNILRDDRRLVKRRTELVAQRRAVLEPDHDAPAPDAELLADEARGRVRDALDELSERDRQLLLLRQEGYSYRELAQIVGVAEGSVGTMLIRAMRAFRTALTRTTDLHPVHSRRGRSHASE